MRHAPSPPWLLCGLGYHAAYPPALSWAPGVHFLRGEVVVMRWQWMMVMCDEYEVAVDAGDECDDFEVADDDTGG